MSWNPVWTSLLNLAPGARYRLVICYLWYNIRSMSSQNEQSSSTILQRRQATAAAIASVKAEGLTPTKATAQRLDQYVQGKLTADQLLQQTLAEIRTRSKQTVN